MKKVIRGSVFETNSSSTHSISIDHSKILKTNYSYLSLECGEFGWEEERYKDAQTKLSYVLTGIQYYEKMPEYVDKPTEISWDAWKNHPTKNNYEKERIRVVQESKYLTWILDVLNEFGIRYSPETLEPTSSYDEFGYIDHQSTDVLEDIFCDDEDKFKENFKDFVFNPNSYLKTDNDNH